MVLANNALAADPDFVMGHCLKAYLLLMAANPANRAQIDATLARAQGSAANLAGPSGCTLPPPPAWHQETIERFVPVGGSSTRISATCWRFRIFDTIWFHHGQTQSIPGAGRDRVHPLAGGREPPPGFAPACRRWQEVGDAKGADAVIDAALRRRPDPRLLHHHRRAPHAGHRAARAREGNSGSPLGGHWWLRNNLIPHHLVASHVVRLRPRRERIMLAGYDEHPPARRPMTKATPDRYVDLQECLCAV